MGRPALQENRTSFKVFAIYRLTFEIRREFESMKDSTKTNPSCFAFIRNGDRDGRMFDVREVMVCNISPQPVPLSYHCLPSTNETNRLLFSLLTILFNSAQPGQIHIHRPDETRSERITLSAFHEIDVYIGWQLQIVTTINRKFAQLPLICINIWYARSTCTFARAVTVSRATVVDHALCTLFQAINLRVSNVALSRGYTVIPTILYK